MNSSHRESGGGRSFGCRPFGRLAVDRGPVSGKDLRVQFRAPATILVVDDYPPNLTALEAALEPLEQRVVKASSGAEALKFLLSEESCALILLDVNMPGQDGFETADLIRSRGRTRGIPILFMTAATRPEGPRLAAEHGGSDYILRPVEPEVLRTKVRGILELRERADHLEQQLLRTAEHQRAQLVTERRLERRYRSLVEATAQVVWSMDRDGDVVEDSPSWRAFTGQSLEQLAGRGFLEAIHPDDRARAERTWEVGFAEKFPCDLEFRLRRGDGTYADVLSRGVPVLDDDGTVLEWLGTCIDLTEHKRADEEVRASRDQLDALYKREQEAVRARDDFLSIASHELRTPLTPLRLQVQILRRLLAQGESLRREKLVASLDTLERQTERLGRLVSDLLDVSRITAGKLTLRRERLDLADVARDVVERYAGASRSRIALTTESAPGSWDRASLEQVATNLLANAIKYGEGKPIDVTVAPRDGVAVLAVRDRGIGIAAGDVERIFGRFERATSATSYGGLGLGLYIAQQIAVAHGGRISVESAPGQGATFTVALPPGEP
jgi:PAS domain S-box-containing protein